jgi:aspartate-semialdehyde dehydrogenase
MSAMTNFACRPLVLAIVGATGAVGIELLRCLERRRFAVAELRLFASPRSAGKRLSFMGVPHAVATLGEGSFAGVDIALFSAGSATAKRFAPVAVAAGAVVIDNSSAFRMAEDVPLVVPEINATEIARHRGLIANPNCVAISAAVPLWPIHRHNPILRIVLASYRAASGAGATAMEELLQSTRAYLGDQDRRRRRENHFPMPLEASGRDEILVGRIRRDASDDDGPSIALFAVGDQLLKGAALNAVQIAEHLLWRRRLRASGGTPKVRPGRRRPSGRRHRAGRVRR